MQRLHEISGLDTHGKGLDVDAFVENTLTPILATADPAHGHLAPVIRYSSQIHTLQ
jgi:hypothetical protein